MMKTSKMSPETTVSYDHDQPTGPRFDLRDMIASTGRDMTALAESMSYPGRALNRRERELAKTAITGTQMAILDELAMFVIAGSQTDTYSSYISLRELMDMKAEL